MAIVRYPDFELAKITAVATCVRSPKLMWNTSILTEYLGRPMAKSNSLTAENVPMITTQSHYCLIIDLARDLIVSCNAKIFLIRQPQLCSSALAFATEVLLFAGVNL